MSFNAAFQSKIRLPLLIPAKDSAQAGFFVFEGVLGIIINLFFFAVLLIGEKGRSDGKKLLLFVHGNEFVFLLSVLFPFVSAMARNDVLETPECALPSALFHTTTMLEPLSIALMAYHRWRLVTRAIDNDTRVINLNRWIFGVTATCAILVACDLGWAYSDGLFPFFGPFFICLQTGELYPPLVITLFFVTAPFVIFFTHKLIKIISGQRKAVGTETAQRRVKESILLIKGLTVSLYLFHSPWFIGWLIVRFHGSLPWEVAQGRMIVYVAHACFSPLFSLLLVPRYRQTSLDFFKALSIHSFTGSADVSGGSTSSTNKSSGHARAKSTGTEISEPASPRSVNSV